MEVRFACSHCRGKFSASGNTETVVCPHCTEIQRLPSHGNSIIRQFIHKFLRGKLKKLLFDSTQKPADSYRSSSSSACALDNPRAYLAKKRAVLCGVSYKNWKYKLKGTINDVFNMKEFLIQKFAFQEQNMLVLTEEQADNRLIPTKANIENCLQWLVKDCKPGDSLVFYYSGHGLRQPDFNKDELDGFDETICPVDFLQEGMILDNDIYTTIVKPLPVGVTLHAIVDACHSGTILDLEHVYDRERKMWMDNRPPSGVRKQTSGGKAYSISACEDDQLAADTSAFSSEASMSGALTYILIDVVRANPSITYRKLLDKMQKRIDEANQEGCFGRSRRLSRIFGPNLTQKPLLSASEEFDVYSKKFEL